MSFIQLIQQHGEYRLSYRRRVSPEKRIARKGMTPNEIKGAMMMRGITQAEIAKVYCCGQTRVSNVVNGRSANLQIRRAIADAIEKPITEIFPDEIHRRPSGRIRIPSDYYQAAMAAAG